MNDQSSAASPRQTAVQPLTDDCDDDKSSDDADEGKENKKDGDNKWENWKTDGDN